MRTYFLFLLIPFYLSGCIGAFVSGNTRYDDVPYPDIRTIPPRPEKESRKKITAREAHKEALEARREQLEGWRDQAAWDEEESTL